MSQGRATTLARIKNYAKRILLKIGSRDDYKHQHGDVPMAKLASHHNKVDYVVSIGDWDGSRVLEVGSRDVTHTSTFRDRLKKAEYVGFDYYAGPNVDVVGDAHHLSEAFPGQKFDIIYSESVFEHLANPWLVAWEIAKLLRVGGTVVIETHFSFSSHERPWHFFHFTDMGLRALFSPALGIECVEAGFSNPIVGRFSALADDYLRLRSVDGLYCHSSFVGKKVREVDEDFDWRAIDISQIVGGTTYPAPAPSS